jgi:hypothetical protein
VEYRVFVFVLLLYSRLGSILGFAFEVYCIAGVLEFFSKGREWNVY